MTRFALILTAGFAVAYGVSLLPLEQIDVVGRVWSAVFKVFAYAVVGAVLVRVLTVKRR